MRVPGGAQTHARGRLSLCPQVGPHLATFPHETIAREPLKPTGKSVHLRHETLRMGNYTHP